jgi:hypothetical protein
MKKNSPSMMLVAVVFFFFCVVSIEDTKPPAPYIENGIDK